MSKRPYQICTRCVMDTSDAAIDFDAAGVCDHCRDFEANVRPNWKQGDEGKEALRKIVEAIRESGKGKQFDCILGLSGGLDSSYMLHLIVTEFGLRPLVFHVDGGWNTDIAVNNIQMLVEKLGLDLYTEVINWEDMRDFQLAFFKAGVPHLDIPQDHAFIATLYHFANAHGVKYIMNGGNIATECVRNPLEWLYYGTDMAQIPQVLIYNKIDLNGTAPRIDSSQVRSYAASSLRPAIASGMRSPSCRRKIGSMKLGDLASPSGRSIRFTIPQTVPSRGEVPPMVVQSGTYRVYVENANGTSNTLVFTIRNPHP